MIARGLAALVVAAMAGAAPVAQDSGVPDVILLEATRSFDALDYERAVPALDRVVSLLEARPSHSPAEREQLAEAYEMRARSRFGLGDRDGARADFQSLLTLDPAHALTGQISPNVVAIFDELKKTLVGTLNLRLAPEDAELVIDGVAAPSASGLVPIIAGEHTVAARQSGYRPATVTVSVAAGAVVDVTLELERVSATINLMTAPAEVEVIVDGVSRGLTAPGPPPAEYADLARTLGVAPGALSRPFFIADVAPGTHVIELRRACYVSSQRRVEVPKPADYRLDPVKMVSAVGVLSVTSSAPGSVFVDGETRGTTPAAGLEVCEGPHVVEVRSPHGRDLERVTVRTGDRLSMEANPRPAIALLTSAGQPEGLRGGPDLRLSLERLLQDAQSFLLFAPAAEQVEQALAREKLPPGWLSFDRARRPIGEAAANIAPPARRELSLQLAKTFDVQAIASVTLPSRDDRSEVLLTLLAAGSGEPDTLLVQLDEPDSVQRAMRALDYAPPLFRLSAGVHVADVHDVAGAVVVRVEPGSAAAQAGLVPGDVIVSARGQTVRDAAGLDAVLTAARADDRLAVEVRDRADAVKTATLTLVRVPQVVAMSDETLIFNKLLVDFRRQLASAPGPLDQSVARLNLAVSLMRVGSWNEARGELEAVELPDGGGVSDGTVQYLSGLCREALGQLAEAERAWRAAAASKDAMLTADGPLIRDLAEQKLADLARRLRRPAE